MTQIYSLMLFHQIEKLFGLIMIEILFFNGIYKHINFYNSLLSTTMILPIATKFLFSHRQSWSVLQNGVDMTVTSWDSLITNTLLLIRLSQFMLMRMRMFGPTNILSEEQTQNLNLYGGNVQWRRKLSSEHSSLSKNKVNIKDSTFSIRLKMILKQQTALANFQLVVFGKWYQKNIW